MSVITPDTALPVSARPARRDIGIKKRYAAEARFKAYGVIAIVFGLSFLAIMLGSIVSKGYTAFWQTNVTLPVTFDATVLDPQNKRDSDPMVLVKANYDRLAQQALATKLGIAAADKARTRELKGFISDSARIQLRDMLVADPAVTQNVHRLEASGKFGRMALEIHANPSPDNPKTSHMAALSIMRVLENEAAAIVI